MKNLLIIGHVWPEPNSSAAGSRMLQLIRLFQDAHYDITFATTCAKSDKAFDLSQLKVKTQTIQLNHSSFDRFIETLQPDVVLFDRFMTEEQFGWRVAEHCPNALRILDTEDLHGLRKGRGDALKSGQPFDRSFLFNTTAKREIASIYRCDLSLIISEAEMKLLQHDFKVPEDLIYYLPFLLEEVSQESIKLLPSFNNRQHFITIGNFMHQPNADAVHYLKTSIWPLLRKALPEAELHIYGSYETENIKCLHDIENGFLIKGYVEDVNKVMQHAKVCLVPLRFGAGLKGKLIDAMINGTPCIMSSIAAEGMFGKLEGSGFIEDEVEAFVEKSIQLYEDRTLWQEKQHNGFKIINKRFQKCDFQDAFINEIDAISLELDDHRLNNFTGEMIMHHSMQSTKFMSKWIEEKNKHKIDIHENH